MGFDMGRRVGVLEEIFDEANAQALAGIMEFLWSDMDNRSTHPKS